MVPDDVRWASSAPPPLAGGHRVLLAAAPPALAPVPNVPASVDESHIAALRQMQIFSINLHFRYFLQICYTVLNKY